MMLASARLAVEHDPVRIRIEADSGSLQRLFAACMLSPTLDIYHAFRRGEAIPVDRLDPVWAFRYGLTDEPTP